MKKTEFIIINNKQTWEFSISPPQFEMLRINIKQLCTYGHKIPMQVESARDVLPASTFRKIYLIHHNVRQL